MTVDPDAARRLTEHIEHLPDIYSFKDWLNSTAVLQIVAYDRDPAELEGDEAADFYRWNAFALISELIEQSNEIGWKPWATARYVNRDQFISEMVDLLHFAGNILRMVECTGEELTAAYKAKQLKNLARQVGGV